MKSVIAMLALLALAGCGVGEQTVALFTTYSKICVEGVSYIQFSSGASVQYNKDGKVVLCKE